MQDVLVANTRVTGVDLQGKKFDKVSRLVAESTDKSISYELDYHSDLLRVKAQDNINVILSFGSEHYDPESFSYGMNGKLFKIDEKDGKSVLFISFGGLLMKLTCPETTFPKVRLGSDCRLMLKYV